MADNKLLRRNTEDEKKKKKRLILIIILGLLLVIFGILVGYFLNNSNDGSNPIKISQIDNDTVPWEGEGETYDSEKNPDVIAIPGFDALNFKADSVEQAVSLYNPNQNACYFKMSMILPDGTKIWESKLVAPGQAFYKITLNKKLSVGTYENTVLKYECFSNIDGTGQLNGSEVKFNLYVKE